MYSYSLQILYYYHFILNLINRLPGASIDDPEFSSFDSKNNLSEKLLLLHYLITNKKLSLTVISQDVTKQARILSFLFDNGAESLRKKLPLIEQSKVKEIKSKSNLTKVLNLINSLGTEFYDIKNEIIKDLK